MTQTTRIDLAANHMVYQDILGNWFCFPIIETEEGLYRSTWRGYRNKVKSKAIADAAEYREKLVDRCKRIWG